MQILAFFLCGLGAFITTINFYLSFLRFPLHLLRGGTRASYRWTSAIPLVGSMSLWIGAALIHRSSPVLMWLAIAVSVLDTGGLHWFVASMIYHHFRDHSGAAPRRGTEGK